MSGERTGAAALVHAIDERERFYRDALARLTRIVSGAARELEAGDLERTLMEALELVSCLRRMVKGRTVEEIHAAFGAPGDFGYETPIGAALHRLYRGGS